MRFSFLRMASILAVTAMLGVACSDDGKVGDEEKPKTDDIKVEEDTVDTTDGYEYVDLGLSAMWATYNVGATKPEEFGDYYAWGETETKTDYSWETYKWCRGSENSLTKYCHNSEYGYNGYSDKKMVLDPEDDVAQVKWGGNWRMPNRDEIGELVNNCTWTRNSLNGVEGFTVTGPSGNSIFIPAAGYYSGTEWIESELYEDNRDGDLWSSTPDDDYRSYFIYFLTSRGEGVASYARYRGWSVRPVFTSEAWWNAVSVHMEKDSMVLLIGKTDALTATVQLNDKVMYRQIEWSSADTTVATVSNTGLVKALSVGTTTITASLNDKTATCTIKVVDESGIEHEYVDLGLSVKWATCNLGAYLPQELGDHYAWGETEPYYEIDYSQEYKQYYWKADKSDGYALSMYKFLTSGDTYDDAKYYKYNNDSRHGTVDNKTILDPEDDAAHVRWGGSWRMPTKEEQMELLENCTWTWNQRNNIRFGGRPGYIVTSNKEGYTDRCIFIPAAGCRMDTNLYWTATDGIYWSSSLDTSNPNYAITICFVSNVAYSNNNRRCLGFSIRPVCP